MAEPVAPTFQKALRRKASKYNALFAAAQALCALDADRFAAHLRDVVAPIVEALATFREGDQAAIDTLTEVLIRNSIDLMSRGLLASETPSPDIHALYAETLPNLAPFLGDDPGRLITALTTALPLLARQDEALPRHWLQSLVHHCEPCQSTDELLDLGKVLAWTQGMAHFRDSALAVYKTLSKDIQNTLPPYQELSQRWPNLGEFTLLGTAGAFLGFGGHFAAPPVLELFQGNLFAFDGNHYFSIHADRFGATTMRFAEEDLPAGPPKEQVHLPPTILAHLPKDFPGQISSACFVFQHQVLALTLPFSFKVYLFYLPREMRP